MGVALDLQLVLEFYAAFGRGDIAGALNKLTDDVVWLMPGPKDSRCLGNLAGKAVTEVEPAGPFWEAEPEHQDYLQRYPNGYTCHYIRSNWRLRHRAA